MTRRLPNGARPIMAVSNGSALFVLATTARLPHPFVTWRVVAVSHVGEPDTVACEDGRYRGNLSLAILDLLARAGEGDPLSELEPVDTDDWCID